MTNYQKIFQHKNPWIFSQWELNCFMRTIGRVRADRRIDMTKLIVAFSNFSNACIRSLYIALFMYRLQTTTFQKDHISTCLSTEYIYVRELVRKRQAVFCCLFVIHTLVCLRTYPCTPEVIISGYYNVQFCQVGPN